MPNLEFTISNLERNVAAILKAVNTLTDSHNTSKDEIKQLRVDFDLLHDAIPTNPNVWLKPSELGAILKISTSTVTKYRNEGHFKKTSMKEVIRGKRTDFYYHRISAVKDISKLRPIQIAGKKIINSFS